MKYETREIFFYSFVARIYDWMCSAYGLNSSDGPRAGLARHLPQGKFSFLEICSGTAETAIAAALSRPEAEITGIDITEGMMAVAMRKISSLGIGTIKIMHMNARRLLFSDSSFDCAAVSLALHEMPDDAMADVLREGSRVLKKGGLFFIIEWHMPALLKKKMAFLPVRLAEPGEFGKFLAKDWRQELEPFGLHVTGIEYYGCTQLIIAEKRG